MALMYTLKGRTFVGTPKKKLIKFLTSFGLMQWGRAYYMVVRYKFPSGLKAGRVIRNCAWTC